MTGQVDVGFGAAPFGLDLVESGKTRIIATGNDVVALRTRAVRVNLTGAATLQNKHDALVRFMQAYRETVDWMYSSPDALRIYGEYSGLPANIVQRVLQLVPKEALQSDQVKGLDDVMTDAVAQKFLAAPLTPDQVKELVQIPK
jgi:NitT/TauT family transport system substrate-binding protein